MNTLERRLKVEKILKSSREPITGSALARNLNVSRQVIVQDIALLRAKGIEIISTLNGYIIKTSENEYIEKIICKQHDSIEEVYRELQIIVDMGGKIVDIIVDHPVYGNIKVELNINSKRDIDNFIKKIEETNSLQLSSLTKGNHGHTIKAESKQVLEDIMYKLKEEKMII